VRAASRGAAVHAAVQVGVQVVILAGGSSWAEQGE
jgi:hypothetical protein